MTHIPRVPAFECVQREIGLNDIAFGFKVEKLIKKIKRCKDKLDQEKMFETMVELKLEVEAYTGKKISIDKELDRVEKDMRNGGAKLKKDEFKNVRKAIKKAESRSNHKLMYMADCLAFGIDYDAELENLNYIAKHGNDKDNKEEEITLPLRLTVGVTMALCGFFLMVVPIPICQSNGPWIAQAGLALAIDATIARYEKNEKNNKDNK